MGGVGAVPDAPIAPYGTRGCGPDGPATPARRQGARRASPKRRETSAHEITFQIAST